MATVSPEQLSQAVEQARSELQIVINERNDTITRMGEAVVANVKKIEILEAELKKVADAAAYNQSRISKRDADHHVPDKWDGEKYSFSEFEYRVQNYLMVLAPDLDYMKVLKQAEREANMNGAVASWVKREGPSLAGGTGLPAYSAPCSSARRSAPQLWSSSEQ